MDTALIASMNMKMDGANSMSGGMSPTAMWICVGLLAAILVVLIVVLMLLNRIHRSLQASRVTPDA